MTAVYDPRVGNAGWLATSKAKARARGCWQNATVVSTPEEAAFTNQWAGTGHCPHLPGSLCSLALLRDIQTKANSPEGAHDSLTVATSCRPPPQWALPHVPAVSAISLPLPSQTEQASPDQLLLSFTLVWVGNRQWGGGLQADASQNQSWAPGVTGWKKRKGMCSSSHKCKRLNPYKEPKAVDGLWEQLWTLGARRSWNKSRSESELTVQHPQQVQGPSQKCWRTSWVNRMTVLTVFKDNGGFRRTFSLYMYVCIFSFSYCCNGVLYYSFNF